MAHSLGTAIGIDVFLRQVWIVVPDPEETEYIRTPDLQLEEWRRSPDAAMRGDCDDAAVMAGALLDVLQIPASFVAVRLKGDSEFSHVYIRAVEDFRNYGGYDRTVVDIDPIVPETEMPVKNVVEVIEVVL